MGGALILPRDVLTKACLEEDALPVTRHLRHVIAKAGTHYSGSNRYYRIVVGSTTTRMPLLFLLSRRLIELLLINDMIRRKDGVIGEGVEERS